MITTSVRIKKPSIKTTRIAEKNVLGYAYQNDFEIEIDPRQSSKEYFNTCIHECFHIWFPDLKEKHIIRLSDMLSEILWRRGYRRVSKGNVVK